jgi:hypothetical protein
MSFNTILWSILIMEFWLDSIVCLLTEKLKGF